jgi:hypothetical protein
MNIPNPEKVTRLILTSGVTVDVVPGSLEKGADGNGNPRWSYRDKRHEDAAAAIYRANYSGVGPSGCSAYGSISDDDVAAYVAGE